jgi:hypothetical protein
LAEGWAPLPGRRTTTASPHAAIPQPPHADSVERERETNEVEKERSEREREIERE